MFLKLINNHLAIVNQITINQVKQPLAVPHLDHAGLGAVLALHLEVGQEVVRHLDQGVTWPPQEPVHGATGN